MSGGHGRKRWRLERREKWEAILKGELKWNENRERERVGSWRECEMIHPSRSGFPFIPILFRNFSSTCFFLFRVVVCFSSGFCFDLIFAQRRWSENDQSSQKSGDADTQPRPPVATKFPKGRTKMCRRGILPQKLMAATSQKIALQSDECRPCIAL